MNLLILKKFNNYYNRIVKKYSTIADYVSNAFASRAVGNFNFNPNDGVTTEVILGTGDLAAFFDFEKTNSADYLVAYNTVIVDEDEDPIDVIDSRWFITEAKRTRAGQYQLFLKRDSIADNLDTLLDCPAYIQKGIVDDNSPLILNDENIRVNQIKSGEDFLKDRTGSAWIVGYMPKQVGVDEAVANVSVPSDSINYITLSDLATEAGLSENVLSNVLTTAQNNPSSFIADGVAIVGYINVTGNGSWENKVVATYDDCETYIGGRWETDNWHPAVADCFATGPGKAWSTLEGNVLASKWKAAIDPQLSYIRNNWGALNGNIGLPFLSRKAYQVLNSHVGEYIYKAGTFYKLRLGASESPVNTGDNIYASSIAAPYSTICDTFVTSANTWYGISVFSLRSSGKVIINYNKLVANFYLEELGADDQIAGFSFTMSSSRNACDNQVYDMFAIPYSSVPIKDGVNTYEGIGAYAQRLAVAIAEKCNAGTYQLYDLQLLPYCPVDEVVDDNRIDITSLTSGYDYDWITFTGTENVTTDYTGIPTAEEIDGHQYAVLEWQTVLAESDIVDYGAEDVESPYQLTLTTSYTIVGGKVKFRVSCPIADADDVDHISLRIWVTYPHADTYKKSIVLYPRSASFTRIINKTLELKNSMKIEALCNNYRLVSPNYQGSFDFNVAKNSGSCSGFKAECTYKPYTPYIKVVPEFNWMYGKDYHDCRGLICGGDYSLGRVNSAWETYQLENKNYQNIFNREIQNLDVQQSIQRTQQQATGAINIVNAGGKGAGTGALVGGGYGAIAGAILGTGASAVGYGADLHLMEKGFIEQKQYAIDKYQLQLANIQAIPYTLTKVNSFDINSKVWPIIEYYTCTDEEKEYLENKIKYEGMTVGVIDLLGKYLVPGSGNYCQAYLVRNENITDDPHQLDDINAELLRGVYM